MIVDDRIILNGNRLFFIEPLESSSTQTYIEVAQYFGKYGIGDINYQSHTYIRNVQNFILWHYQFGSKYDTPFWNYAKSLKFIDSEFDSIVKNCKNLSWYDLHRNLNENAAPTYGQWNEYSFKLWYEGMTKKLK